MHDVRQKLTALTKSEFLEQIRNLTEHRSEEAKMQEAYLGSPESRMKLFCDDEKPTDSSAGPFQSHRFGAVFLLPGE
uniref:Uncharacterized protein n=1 Tax=Caenorhabditis japonica TaxID=281687 RepID=A0A8R1I596_CAEJA